VTDDPFADLLTANASYAERFEHGGFDGIARAGVAIVTCMDSRIVPLALLGLELGDAKIFRNPGGRVTPQALEALVLGVHLLGVDKILVVPHTRCAMASATEAELHRRVSESAGIDASFQASSTTSTPAASPATPDPPSTVVRLTGAWERSSGGRPVWPDLHLVLAAYLHAGDARNLGSAPPQTWAVLPTRPQASSS
jgi:carbonic anhydrase